MNFDVAVNGRPWKVALEPAEQPGRFNVVVKGKQRSVDVSWIDADTVSLIAGATARVVRLDPRESGTLGVALGGRRFEIVVSAGEARPKPRATDLDAAAVAGSPAVSPPRPGQGFSHAIKAPMPGRVVSVLVKVGDRVTAHQAVIVVEAMKMENELRTSMAGTVTQVPVVKGAAVEMGMVLVEVEIGD